MESRNTAVPVAAVTETRVLIVEDSAVVQERLAKLLAAASGIRLVGQAGDAQSALALIGQTRPDAVVLDLGLRGGSGLEVLERLQAMPVRPAVVVLTNYPLDEYRRRSLELGAVAFLDKTSEFDQVVGALTRVAAAPPQPAVPAPPVSLDRVIGFGPAVLFVLKVEAEGLRTAWVTPNVEGMTGYAPEATFAPGWHRANVHPDDRPSFDRMLDRLFAQDGAEITYQFQHRDGTWMWLHDELRLVRDAEGRPIEVIGAMLNVSERERAKEALADREARYRALAEATSDAIIVLENGMIREVSRTFSDLYGYAGEDLVGRPALEFVAPRSQPAAAARIASGLDSVTEVQLVTKTGEYRDVRVTGRVHRIRGREQRLLALHDLTARRELERQLQQAQKMEAVGRLAGTVAHDFNNVLTVVSGCLELALAELETGHASRPDLECARDAVAQGTTLARQLLGFSRPAMDGSAQADPNAVLAADEALLRRVVGVGIVYEARLGMAVPRVPLSEGQLRQVIMNLAINAKDAMPSGGTLTIATGVVTLDQDPMQPLPAGQYTRLTVSDSGHGMDDATQVRIFEPFFTTKGPGKGTGLGLASVYGIVTAAGGAIHVTSAPGQGSSFELFLPAHDAPARGA